MRSATGYENAPLWHAVLNTGPHRTTRADALLVITLMHVISFRSPTHLHALHLQLLVFADMIEIK